MQESVSQILNGLACLHRASREAGLASATPAFSCTLVIHVSWEFLVSPGGGLLTHCWDSGVAVRTERENGGSPLSTEGIAEIIARRSTAT